MIRPTVSVEDAIQFLNELLELDRPAIAALIANHVPCNKDLAEHPTVQVRAQHDGYLIGMLGILNGLFGTDENLFGPIVAVFDDNGRKYNKLVRFEKRQDV